MFESVHDPSQWTAAPPGITDADVQFAIADQRSASEVSARLRDLGYEPIWKDWDSALTPSRNGEGEGGSKEERGKGETCGAKEMA